MSRVETFFLGLWLFGYGLWFGFEWRIGFIIMLYVVTMPLTDYVNAKPRDRQRQGTAG